MSKRVFFLLITVMTMVMISGCTSKIPYQKTGFDKETKALVYIYRLASTREEAVTYDVAINDIVVGILYDEAYIPMTINPGDTRIYVQNHDTVKSFVENDAVELKDVRAGDVYYIKAIVGQEGSFSLRLMDYEAAKTEIASTGYLYDQGFKHFKLYKSNTNTTVKPMEAVVKESEPIVTPKAHSVSEPSPNYNVPDASSASSAAAGAAAAVPAAAVSGRTASDRIEKLYNLKEKGAITQEEYNTLKAKILAE